MGLCKAFADDRKWNERSVAEMECELIAFECRPLEIKAVCTKASLLLRSVSQVWSLYQHVTTR
jgi:hypothetical protein